MKDGGPSSTFNAATSENLTSAPGPDEWIKSQRASLARIFRMLEAVMEYEDHEAASSGRSSAQSTLFDLDGFSSKTAPQYGPRDGGKSLPPWWRKDIPGETERLPRLMSERAISAIAGGCLLPTLCARDHKNSGGMVLTPRGQTRLPTALKHMLPTITASMETWADFVQAQYHSSKRPDYQIAKLLPTLLASSGGRTLPLGTTITGMAPDGKKRTVGLDQAIKMLPTLTASDATGGSGTSPNRKGGPNLRTMLPTLCATDYKLPFNEEGYQRASQERSRPLRDTLPHTTGHRLTPGFCEWWMGFPLGGTAYRR